MALSEERGDYKDKKNKITLHFSREKPLMRVILSFVDFPYLLFHYNPLKKVLN